MMDGAITTAIKRAYGLPTSTDGVHARGHR
jgi:hypothetical protein